MVVETHQKPERLMLVIRPNVYDPALSKSYFVSLPKPDYDMISEVDGLKIC